MLKLVAVTLLVAVVVSGSIVPQPRTEGVNVGEITLLTPEEMTRFLEENPDAVPLERTDVKSLAGEQAQRSGTYRITYTMGARASGDSLRDTKTGAWYFFDPTDVTATITYPATGTNGALITFIQIIIGQSNELGRAYVTSGGIGYRYVKMVVESKRTYWFEANYMIFGKN